MSQLTSNFAFISIPSNDSIVYLGETASQSFFGSPTTWISVEGGEVVEEEADDVVEADVDEDANDGDRLRVLTVLKISNEAPKQ